LSKQNAAQDFQLLPVTVPTLLYTWYNVSTYQFFSLVRTFARNCR